MGGTYCLPMNTLHFLQEHTLFVKLSKCSFIQPNNDYLGHVISVMVVEVDLSKVKDMKKWPIPCCIRDVRGFLGLSGYYRRFVCNYGKIAQALIELLKKESIFQLYAEAQQSFDRVKQALNVAPLLALPF
ncbi:hypothetical protein L6164_008587 [Bauhinia variegata]|uniref:Uncharacterized protein n=1 Tax=Bauhinia variegata TaxID=167791 RepID=A0ACB9PGY1_BAUVA|nr:hypothetical protein L6164_008587 [Bauhinia variegata]